MHVETVNEGSRIFAKQIHFGAETLQGEAHGQVVAYDAGNGTISVNDELSARPVRFRVDKSTKIDGGSLAVGSLVEGGFVWAQIERWREV